MQFRRCPGSMIARSCCRSAPRVSSEDDTLRMAILEIEDTGAGIDPEIAKKQFTAFSTTKDDGMGMGLSICRTIVESHGGSISATSGDGRGALFTIKLPVLQDARVDDPAQ